MLRKFAWWFIVFGLSFALQNVFTDQGRAFFGLYFGAAIIITLALLATIVGAGIAAGCKAEANGISLFIVIIVALAQGVSIFIAWVLTKLFNIDFFIAYQIMTFVLCLCPSNNKK